MDSKIFRPPNPWMTGLLILLVEMHRLPDLKLTLKFEVCKASQNGLRSQTLQAAASALSLRSLLCGFPGPPLGGEQPVPDAWAWLAVCGCGGV